MIKDSPILVTTYEHPDLDGTACSYAYAELLNAQGKKAVAAIFGAMHPEAEFVFDAFPVKPLPNAKEIINEYGRIVLVDVSALYNLVPEINASQVIEVIDHRKLHQADKFPNAKVQIELVGSAATLIAEKFELAGVTPSASSAALLYSAIVSNTINFKADVVTSRDAKMASWLSQYFSIPKNYIHSMFAHKSILAKPLVQTFIEDFTQLEFNNHRIGIAQLEIIEIDKFVSKRRGEIDQALLEIKNEMRLDIIFLTLIDLERAYNIFVVIDENTESVLHSILGVDFLRGLAKSDEIIMRKSIGPLVKDYLESKN